MSKKSTLPIWLTPKRKADLIALFVKSGGFCVLGHKNCLIPDHNYYVFTEGLIDDWQADDRQARAIDYELDRLRLHYLAEPKTPIRGRFSAISRDIYNANKPLYYLEGIGLNALTFEPFVRVRMSSSYMRLYVNLGSALRGVSKSKKRKALRYGKPLPKAVTQSISELVKQSVLDYLKH